MHRISIERSFRKTLSKIYYSVEDDITFRINFNQDKCHVCLNVVIRKDQRGIVRPTNRKSSEKPWESLLIPQQLNVPPENHTTQATTSINNWHLATRILYKGTV